MASRSALLWRAFGAGALLMSAVIGAPSVVLAQGNGGRIHSCVNPQGKIRVVAPDTACKSNETVLDWNIQGPPGPPGPPGMSERTQVKWSSKFDKENIKKAFARCPDGTKVAGGGGGATTTGYRLGPGQVAIKKNGPADAGDGWHVTAEARDDFDGTWGVTAHAICAVIAE